MGNKVLIANKADGGTLDIGKALPQIKLMLSKLEMIYPGHNLHYLFLDADFDPLIANTSWGDLEVGQRVVNSIFAKLRLTAKQFAQTLNESETRCIHMKGDSAIFSYYAIKDFHLVIHRTLPESPVSSKPSTPNPNGMASVPSSTLKPPQGVPKAPSPTPPVDLKQSNSSLGRDKSPLPRIATSSPAVSFTAGPSSSAVGSEHTSPRSRLPGSGGANQAATSVLYRDDEDKSVQVEAIIIVVQELLYGPTQKA